MTDRDKVPEKIDMEAVLGTRGGGGADAGEIELLDPSTGEPVAPAEQGEAAAPRQGQARIAPDEDVRDALAEKERYHDLWIRARADFENFRKRIEREREEERTQAGASLVRDLLPVLDNMERALALEGAKDPFRDGVDLIQRQLREALTRAGLEPIDALGEPFNPVYHEAVVTERTDRFEPNRVVEEIQKGYMFRGRVLRPALVKVSIALSEQAPPRGAAPAPDTEQD
jgi:molecular chaperone GrpE